MRLKDKVAVITGASRGIGREIALTFARQGAAVVLSAKTVHPNPRLPGTLLDVQKEIESLGARCLVAPCDVRDEHRIVEVIEETKSAFGGVDVLINNAGALWWKPVLETPVKRLDLVMDVNIRAAFLFCQAALPSLIDRGGGHIVNMSPPVDLSRLKGYVAYFISKYGMTMLTLGLAEEVREHRVAVNSLWPVTAIDTAAVRNYGVGAEDQWRKPSIMADAVLELVTHDPTTMTGRALSDEEILRAAGITDFSQYAVKPGTNPPPIDWLAGGLQS